MSGIERVRKRCGWVHPGSDHQFQNLQKFVAAKDQPILAEADVRFLLGLQDAMRVDEDSDPSDVFQAQQAACDAFNAIINHIVWQGVRIKALEASTPGDTQELVAARRRIEALEAAVESAAHYLGEVRNSESGGAA